jgi:hypothetical protein
MSILLWVKRPVGTNSGGFLDNCGKDKSGSLGTAVSTKVFMGRTPSTGQIFLSTGLYFFPFFFSAAGIDLLGS